MRARSACVTAMGAVALLACGTETWSFDGDAGSEASVPLEAGQAEAASRCSIDTDCTIANLHCDPASGQCVACVNDTQCTQPGRPRCDSALQQCVQCGVTGDCPRGQVCEPTSRTCLASCSDGGGCPSGTQCVASRGVCVACVGNSDCTTSSSGPVCDTNGGQCVQCLNDGQCASPTRRCNPASDKCVQCLTGSDCDEHVCDPIMFTCVSEQDN